MIKIYQDLLLKMDQSLLSIRNYNVNNKIRVKTPMLRADLCNFSDAYIVVKGDIAVTEPNNAKKTKALHLKTTHFLSTAFQRSMVY